MRTSTPWWALLSSAAAPLLLIGGWTLAARLQPTDFDSAVDTISALAASGAPHRWLMTSALLGVGGCHLVTAAGLIGCAVAGRLLLALGGVLTMLVAAFPLPATGTSAAHTVAAAGAFTALATWPALGRARGPAAPALRPAASFTAAVVLSGLVAWFAVSLYTGDRVGLAERVAAGAQACWPLLAVASARSAAGASGRGAEPRSGH